METQKKKESWSSQTGVILAVTGSAVGLANFLRFPGQAAQFGGGAFMLAYFLSLVILALPIAWAEWTMGRMGGQKGFSSCPGILNVICKHPSAKYFGILGVMVPLVIYMFYSYVEAWCLGYAVNFATNSIHFSNIDESSSFWAKFIGAGEDGSAIGFGYKEVGVYLIVATIINLTLIYRGISKGIETFVRYAIPALILIAFIILIRVLTLGTPDSSKPQQNVINGLGFMWNPTKVYFEELNKSTDKWDRVVEVIGDKSRVEHNKKVEENPSKYRVRNITVLEQLRSPNLWLAAAGQVFFSLSVGLGIIITYASYLKKDDDVVLSSLCACSANEFTEVGLGGLIGLPAAFAFLGAAGVVGQTTFGLGFKSLPMVFSAMEFGSVFGSLFFFLLFLAAVNGSISCLQPSIAFLEETLRIGRKSSVALVGLIATLGVGFVLYFSKDAMALEALNFWAGTFLVYVIATVQIIIFSWVLGVNTGFEEAHKGAAVKIPYFFKFITKYVSPAFLLTIFAFWIIFGVLGVGRQGLDPHIIDLIGSADNEPSIVAWASIALILVIFIFMSLIVSRAPGYKLKKEKQ